MLPEVRKNLTKNALLTRQIRETKRPEDLDDKKTFKQSKLVKYTYIHLITNRYKNREHKLESNWKFSSNATQPKRISNYCHISYYKYEYH